MQEAPTVQLAGRDWPVPKMAIRQSRIIVPGLIRLLPRLAGIISTLPADSDKDDTAWLSSLSLTTEDFDLISEIVYTALTRGTAGLARNEFDNMEMSLIDLFRTLPLIMTQSGVLSQQEQPQVGEQAAAATSQKTSTG